MFVSLKALLTRSIQLTVLVLVVLTFSDVAFGQTQAAAADLQGTIKDSTGAVVPNATITVRNPGTNISRTGVFIRAYSSRHRPTTWRLRATARTLRPNTLPPDPRASCGTARAC